MYIIIIKSNKSLCLFIFSVCIYSVNIKKYDNFILIISFITFRCDKMKSFILNLNCKNMKKFLYFFLSFKTALLFQYKTLHCSKVYIIETAFQLRYFEFH